MIKNKPQKMMTRCGLKVPTNQLFGELIEGIRILLDKSVGEEGFWSGHFALFKFGIDACFWRSEIWNSSWGWNPSTSQGDYVFCFSILDVLDNALKRHFIQDLAKIFIFYEFLSWFYTPLALIQAVLLLGPFVVSRQTSFSEHLESLDFPLHLQPWF